MGLKESLRNYRVRRRGFWVTLEELPVEAITINSIAPSTVPTEALNRGAGLAGNLKSPLERRRRKGK